MTNPSPITPWKPATRWWPIATAIAIPVLVVLELLPQLFTRSKKGG